jgi:hypothetical protein
MKQPQPKGEAETYVGLRQPDAIRKPLLEAAKTAVASEKHYETIRALQEQKLAVRGQLAASLKEVRDELSQLQMILPERDVRDLPTPAQAGAPVAKKKIVDHRVDKIEAALAEIENRLKTL